MILRFWVAIPVAGWRERVLAADLGLATRKDMSEIREAVRRLGENFLVAYRAENPKKK